MKTIQLDAIASGNKSALLSSAIDTLKTGESIIVNLDHDPTDYLQELYEGGIDGVKHDYLKRGPYEWKVQLTRIGEAAKQKKVGDFVSANYKTATVFKKHRIDFCCGGNRSLQEVCAAKGLNTEEIEAELNTILAFAEPEVNYNALSDEALIELIIKKHHDYVNSSIPVINDLLKKVVAVHSTNHPELNQVADAFHGIAFELQNHMPKEEMILFPYIRKMNQAHESGTHLPPPPFGTIQNPIRMMEQEHTSAGIQLNALHEATNGYKVPEEACASYRVLYSMLYEFETKLHEHIHLENNLLFPKAVRLEQTLIHV